jgi:hypothetical protein
MNTTVMPRFYDQVPFGPWFDGRRVARPDDPDLCYSLQNVILRELMVPGDEAVAEFDVSQASGYYRTHPAGPGLWVQRYGLNSFTAVLGIKDDPAKPDWRGLGDEMVDRLDRCFIAKAPLTIYSALGKWTLIIASTVDPPVIIFPTIMPPQPGGYFIDPAPTT